MSYRRAWVLVDTINRAFREPIVRASTGGRTGGGAVTPFGRDVLRRYLRMQAKATRSIERDRGTFRTLLKSRSRL